MTSRNTKLHKEMKLSPHFSKSYVACSHKEDDMKQTKMTQVSLIEEEEKMSIC